MKEVPSLHDHICMHGNRNCSLYEIGRGLSARRMRRLIGSLNEKGYAIKALEFYEYSPTDALRHLFVRMEEEAEPIPYFQLDTACWQAIVEELLKSIA